MCEYLSGIKTKWRPVWNSSPTDPTHSLWFTLENVPLLYVTYTNRIFQELNGLVRSQDKNLSVSGVHLKVLCARIIQINNNLDVNKDCKCIKFINMKFRAELLYRFELEHTSIPTIVASDSMLKKSFILLGPSTETHFWHRCLLCTKGHLVPQSSATLLPSYFLTCKSILFAFCEHPPVSCPARCSWLFMNNHDNNNLTHIFEISKL